MKVVLDLLKLNMHDSTELMTNNTFTFFYKFIFVCYCIYN